MCEFQQHRHTNKSSDRDDAAAACNDAADHDEFELSVLPSSHTAKHALETQKTCSRDYWLISSFYDTLCGTDTSINNMSISDNTNSAAAVLVPSTATATTTTTTTTANGTADLTLADALTASSQTRPSTVYTTTDRTAAVQLRSEQIAAEAAAANDAITAENARIEPVAIPALLNRTVQEFPDTVALRFQEASAGASAANEWKTVTFKYVIVREVLRKLW